ncbi:MAG: rubrerythrin-like domain-containing protein [Halobacteriales archaeon]|nr:rubrerythrin-like domain-containing protein [Halobacteriales archaeon]
MRPEPQRNGQSLHECQHCGRRTEDPNTRLCSECGGRLRNISQPRDL